MLFWRDKWILIKYQMHFFSSYCSTQNDPLGTVPKAAEDCHQFSRFSMTLSKLLYSLQKNAGSKNSFWHLGELTSISSHNRMQLLETVCPFHFSKTNWFPECNKKRLRLSSKLCLLIPGKENSMSVDKNVSNRRIKGFLITSLMYCYLIFTIFDYYIIIIS